MALKLPSKICILDIETEKTKFKNPEKSKLAFSGIKVYTLRKDRYYPCKHRCFLPEHNRELEEFLKGFNGIIIGHNIFQFDYRVLRPLISLDGVIEKSVDTLAFLYKKNGRDFSGLSLNNLSLINLGKEKTIKGKFISELWCQGKRKEVIKYNENDCILTKALWWHLLTERSIDTFNKSFNVFPDDVSYLTGKNPLFTFPAWKQKIERDGDVLKNKIKLGDIKAFKNKIKLNAIKCPLCGRNYYPITTTKEDFDTYLENYVDINNMSEGQFADFIAEIEAGITDIHCCSKCIKSFIKK